MPRIGGELELYPYLFARPEGVDISRYLPFENYILVDSGRSALYIALLDIVTRGGKREAWVPAYSCSSLVQPFILLNFRIHYYSMGLNLTSPFGLPEHLDGETFLYINYFGKINYPIQKWIIYQRSQGYSFFVIEDCAQSLFTENAGTTGDYSIYSLRKFIEVPDGGAIISKYGLAPALFPLGNPDEEFISQKVVGKLIRGYEVSDKCLNLLRNAEILLDNFTGPRAISWISRYLLQRVDYDQVISARRNNWLRFRDILMNQSGIDLHVEPLFTELAAGEVPLGFPIRIKMAERDRLRSYLESQGIYCPIHWILTSEVHSWMQDLELSKTILTIPIDQRVSDKDLLYVAKIITDYFKNTRSCESKIFGQ